MADIGDMWVVTGKSVILLAGPFQTSLSFNGTHGVTSQNAVLFKQQSHFSCQVILWNCLLNIPEICLWFTVRIKPTSAREVMRICYNVSAVNPLHVSANFSGHLQGGIIRRMSYKDVKTNVLI
jgi:hypothetical protein